MHKSDHLYAAYRNSIERILKAAAPRGDMAIAPLSSTSPKISIRRVTLAPSAISRFERLSDRIELVILKATQEFIAEKESLVSTV